MMMSRPTRRLWDGNGELTYDAVPISQRVEQRMREMVSELADKGYDLLELMLIHQVTWVVTQEAIERKPPEDDDGR